MSEVNNSYKKMQSRDKSVDDMSGGKIESSLNSDNSFSDNGLENNRLLNETMKKEKSE